MTDIRLDDNGDIDITNNEVSLTDTGPESTAQRIRITLQTNRTEWDFNTSFGIPYFDLIFIKSTPKYIVDAEFRSQILAVEGVQQLVKFESIIDIAQRTYTLTFTVIDDLGQAVDLTVVL